MAGKGEQLNEAELPRLWEGRISALLVEKPVCGETGTLRPMIGIENGTAALETWWLSRKLGIELS